LRTFTTDLFLTFVAFTERAFAAHPVSTIRVIRALRRCFTIHAKKNFALIALIHLCTLDALLSLALLAAFKHKITIAIYPDRSNFCSCILIITAITIGFHALRACVVLIAKSETTSLVANTATNPLISTRREVSTTMEAANYAPIHQHLIVSHEKINKGQVWV